MDAVKNCGGCKSLKPMMDFYPQHSQCKICCNLRSKEYRKKNAERCKDSVKAWQKKHPERVRYFINRWRAKNTERSKQVNRRWLDNNKEKTNATYAQRRARKLNAYPVWASVSKMNAIYNDAKVKSILTEMPYHVDHDIPLLGKTVCGLHVENNLTIISSNENQRKCASFFDKGWIPGNVWLAGINKPYSSYPSFLNRAIRRKVAP